MRILRDQFHREVGLREQQHQRQKRQACQQPLYDRHRAHDCAQRAALGGLRGGARHQLQRRQRGGQPQRGETKFG